MTKLDIVTLLRTADGFDLVSETMNEAADEIEQLREALRGVIRVADRKTVEFDAARAALGEAVCDCEDGFRPSYHMGTGERFMLECHKCKLARTALVEKE